MRFVEFTDGDLRQLVVPAKVTHLTDYARQTRISFDSGATIMVDGSLHDVGLKLQGRE